MTTSILVVSNDFKPHFGGVAEMTHQVARGLALGGCQVTVMAPVGETWDDEAAQPYRTTRCLPVGASGGETRLQRFSRTRAFSRELRDVAAAGGIDYVLHMDSFGLHSIAGYLLFRAFRRLKRPSGIMFYGREVLRFAALPRWRQRLFRRMLARTDDLFCISHFTGEQARAAFGERARITISGCGVDPESLPPEVARDEARTRLGIASQRVVLTVARLVPRKGMDMVIRALPRVCARVEDVLYVIAGGGPDGQRLSELARENGCAERVRFEGAFSGDMLPCYYGAADVFVMPSRCVPGKDAEGFGIVYAEAGHYGLPVVGGRSGGVPDAIVDGTTGYLVDPEDPDEIAEALTRLLCDADLRQGMGEAGRRHVHSDLTWEIVCRRYRDRIESTLERH